MAKKLTLSDVTSFRPRNGTPAQAYWEIRRWCLEHEFSFSDVLNALMVPLSFYLYNHCEVEKEKSYAILDLTVGEIPILHVFGGKLYPPRHSVDGTKNHPDLKQVNEKIQYWQERNETEPDHIDNFLRDVIQKPTP